uniref:Hexosyltransferase n=1 Tax=Amphilophus citrinellus TaxID=61819 RepID=A0A3Q0T055_AMPCI
MGSGYLVIFIHMLMVLFHFVFAVSSDDNSEFWLSTDDSPLNLQLQAWVGRTGKEWSAPGEFEKYASQNSRPVRLSAQMRYFFEVIHKQNDRGTDHVEVAWLHLDQDSSFMIIESKYISLYTDESALSMNDVSHIPQTAASHWHTPTKQRSAEADMLIEDRRDSFYKGYKFLQGVLPDCAYKPSYTIKDLPLLRYQGLQFVHLSYIYPNDYTRLTHMEMQTSCFYSESSYYLKMFGFSRYMRLDRPQERERLNRGMFYFCLFFPISKFKLLTLSVHLTQLFFIWCMLDFNFQGWKRIQDKAHFYNKNYEKKKEVKLDDVDNGHLRDYGDEYNYVQNRRRKLFSLRAQGREEDEVYNRAKRRRNTTEDERDYLWRRQGEFDNADDEDLTPAPVVDIQVNWNQTFQASPLDLQAQRSDWIDLQCNISGNLLLHSNDALDIVKTFMDKLNAKHHGRFKLVRVVNVVKRADRFEGSRYLLELELKDVNGQLLRLSQYIYALVHLGGLRNRDFSFKQSQPEVLLCNPVGFHWNPVATVHFVVPVKNQARWVQQLITDMEELFRKSRDANFNLIITDYSSTDMDVRKALQKSSLPSYQYVKLSGNFERSAGLQAGIDLITDDHSIVFLCDLHIQFPPSIIDTIRKHCVEGYMAFAPIVLRLDCGATPLEVNGFGLLGIYKSDLDKVGGMNTKDFTERWGGEDWELLDRILRAGLEVERIYLRNFFHHYHSKRGMWNRRMSTSPR